MIVVVLLPRRGFPGGALTALADRLLVRGVAYAIVSDRPGRCEGTGGVRATATLGWDDPHLLRAGGLIVLGDAVGVHELLRAAAAEDRVLGGIGRGVLALARAKVANDRKVASTPDLADELRREGALPILRAPFVADGRLLTATEAGAPAIADAI